MQSCANFAQLCFPILIFRFFTGGGWGLCVPVYDCVCDYLDIQSVLKLSKNKNRKKSGFWSRKGQGAHPFKTDGLTGNFFQLYSCNLSWRISTRNQNPKVKISLWISLMLQMHSRTGWGEGGMHICTWKEMFKLDCPASRALSVLWHRQATEICLSFKPFLLTKAC